MKQKLKKNFPKLLYIFVLFSFILPIIFIVLMMIFGRTPQNEAGYHSQADYALMLVECVLGLVVVHIPSFLERKLKFELPTVLYVLYLVFLYCAITLGELITIINRNDRLVVQLSPIFVAMFAFCFSVMIGAVWEVYEFTFDGLLGLNMQKFALADGTELSGHLALADTMKDIIVDILGAMVASAVGYISLRFDKHWLKITLT